MSEYRKLTFREYELKRAGYIRGQYDADSRLRFLVYAVAKPYLKDQSMSIYEFMPLAGDPTPEQIARIQQENLEKEMAEARIIKDEIMKAVRNGGV